MSPAESAYLASHGTLPKLVLDPKRWLRGRGDLNSALLLPSGRMCCLGFECLRRGYDESQILGVAFPTNVEKPGSYRIERDDSGRHDRDYNLFSGLGRSGRLEWEIGEINDDETIPRTREGDLRRVELLRPLFAEYLGVELVLGDE